MKKHASIEALESRIAPAFSGVVNLAFLSGSAGAQPGVRFDGDLDNDHSGFSVSDAGDVNGDGLGDLIIGAPDFNVGADNNGAAYVIFGKSTGFGATVDLTNLSSSQGFRIVNDKYTNGDFGGSVAGASDVNGDGYDDILIGASESAQNGFTACGTTTIVFGGSSVAAMPTKLSQIDGTNGFILAGNGQMGERTGSSVAAAGDINGDGYADFLVGARGHDLVVNGQVTAQNVGANYVVYGGNDPHLPIEFLSQLGVKGGNAGFLLEGGNTGDLAGTSVSALGDFNGDGFDDLVIGVPGKDAPGAGGAGAAYVMLGKSANFAPKIALSSLSGASGGQIIGISLNDGLGISVGAAGDVNGDGLADLIVGAKGSDAKASGGGEAYVVFGKTGSIGNISIANADLRIQGSVANSLAGASVSNAGDFNGDGQSDLLVGVPGPGTAQGSAYVVFGKSHFDAPVVLESLDGSAGFQLRGLNVGDQAGASVHSAGDVNGDGYSDVIIGAPQASHGVTAAGESYVVFGSNGGNAVTIDAKTHRTASYTDVDGDLVTIKVNKGELTADMFQLTGANELGGAKLAKIDFTGHDDLAGANVTLKAKPQVINGSLHGNRLADVGLFDGDNEVFGKVNIAGDVGQLQLTTATSFTANSLGVNGLDPHSGPAQFAGFSAVGTVGTFTVKTRVDDVSLFAGTIKKFNVGGDIADSNLLIGSSVKTINIGGDFDHSSLLIGASPFGTNADVKVGTVNVRGDWVASSLTAGISGGADGKIGTNDDAVYPGGSPTILSRIASVVIGGQARGSSDFGDSFGLEAQSIGSVKIGGAKVKLSKTLLDDVLLGSNGDFRLHEIA